MKTIIGIIGSQSMIGSQVSKELSNRKEFKLVKADLEADIHVDITNKKSVNKFFQKYNFDWVVLFSAYTDVNGAEKQRGDKKELCYRINVEGSRNIANACKTYNRKLIFISTDFIFDGTDGLYNENDRPGPDLTKIGWYGITKIMAEKNIQEILPKSYYVILRIAYPYSGVDTGKDDLVLRIVKLFNQNKLYPMFTDQIITPTYIPDITKTLYLLISNNQYGIFHLVSPKVTTQYQFAHKLLQAVNNKRIKLETAKLADVLSNPGITPRPLKGGLKASRIQKLGFMPTSWQEGIKQVKKNID